jgi:hypothetical protein
VSLKGGPELAARLKALKLAFKPMGRQWAQGTAELIRHTAPVKTGRLRSSVRVKSATQRRAQVGAVFYGHILDAGSKEYDIVPRKASYLAFAGRDGRTIFSKKVHKPRQAPMGFAARAAREELRRTPLGDSLIKSWNEAA